MHNRKYWDFLLIRVNGMNENQTVNQRRVRNIYTVRVTVAIGTKNGEMYLQYPLKLSQWHIFGNFLNKSMRYRKTGI